MDTHCDTLNSCHYSLSSSLSSLSSQAQYLHIFHKLTRKSDVVIMQIFFSNSLGCSNKTFIKTLKYLCNPDYGVSLQAPELQLMKSDEDPMLSAQCSATETDRAQPLLHKQPFPIDTTHRSDAYLQETIFAIDLMLPIIKPESLNPQIQGAEAYT